MKDTNAKTIAFVARCDRDIYSGHWAACSPWPGRFPGHTRNILRPRPYEYYVQVNVVKGSFLYDGGCNAVTTGPIQSAPYGVNPYREKLL